MSTPQPQPRLHIVIASTRPGRIGPAIGKWFKNFSDGMNQFDTRLVDLLDFDLPVYNEPVHPRMQQYQHDHTRRWSENVAIADAYVFITPEYNYNPPPALVNALDYVYNEWNYKPCGFVSYGGISGGLRAVQSLKLLVTTLKMMPMVEGGMVPMAWKQLDDQGHFQSNSLIDNSAEALLTELRFWTDGLKTMREQKEQAGRLAQTSQGSAESG